MFNHHEDKDFGGEQYYEWLTFVNGIENLKKSIGVRTEHGKSFD